MNTFKKQLYQATVYRASRDKFHAWVLNNPDLMKDLTDIAFDSDNPYHFKACWILELLAEAKIELFVPYLDVLCNVMGRYTDDSSIRTMAKTAMLIVKENYALQSKFVLNEKQISQITECCMDWLITDQKVAAKAYAAETLYVLGRYQSWIYPELKQILSDGYTRHSAAYQATARKLIKLIDKHRIRFIE